MPIFRTFSRAEGFRFFPFSMGAVALVIGNFELRVIPPLSGQQKTLKRHTGRTLRTAARDMRHYTFLPGGIFGSREGLRREPISRWRGVRSATYAPAFAYNYRVAVAGIRSLCVNYQPQACADTDETLQSSVKVGTYNQTGGPKDPAETIGSSVRETAGKTPIPNQKTPRLRRRVRAPIR